VTSSDVSDAVVVLDSDYFRDPYPLYARVRAADGVFHALLPSGQRVWILTRYEDGRAALADPRLSKRLAVAEELFQRHFQDPTKRWRYDDSVVEHMLNSDPPDHTRLRSLVGKAFTARQVQALRPRIEEIAAGLLDAMAGRHGPVDLIDAYAFPLPTTVICELLGIPEDDRDAFRSWSHTIVNVSGTRDPGKVQADSAAMAAYLGRLMASKRASPRQDLLTALVNATDDGDQLTEVELISMAFLLLVAGHETTVNLISNGMLALLRHPDQLAALRSDPTLIESAVEELLRFDGPVNLTTLRFTTAPFPVAGITIPEGEWVVVALSSANRDPDRFADPDTLDLRRPIGGHIAFARLVQRFPDMRPAVDPDALAWRPSTLVHGLEALPVLLYG
jgi:cytochrome P450